MATPQQTVYDSLTTPSYAGLFRRIVAYILDLLVALALLLLVSVTMRLFRATGIWTPTGGPYFDPEQIWHALGVGSKLLILLAFVISQGTLCFIFFEASPWQATIGKRLLKIYVTDNGGSRISLARSFGRWLAMWFFGLFLGSFLSLITIRVTKKHKALHDMAARTLVMNGRPLSEEGIEPWRVFAAFGLPYIWLIATFMYTM